MEPYERLESEPERYPRRPWSAASDVDEEWTLTLQAALGARSPETVAHLERVAPLVVALASLVGWSQTPLDQLAVAARLHDIGKLALPDELLSYPGELSNAQYALVKRHPEIGASILSASRRPAARLARLVALYHHERWDGLGYPLGLASEEIPLAARIVAVVDAYDVLHHGRVYRPGLGCAGALEALERAAARQFDPFIVDRFLRLLSTGYAAPDVGGH